MSSTDHFSSLDFPINMGNANDFDQVFRLFYPQLCDFSRKYLNSKDDAEEAVVNVFVALWKKAESFRDPGHIRAYLYRSAYNNSLFALRSGKRKAEREFIYSQNTDSFEEGYLNNMIRSELIGMIYREIEALPEQYGRVIRMSFQDGLKNEEIASALNLSVQTVKNYKNKGLSLLRTKIPTDAWLAMSFIILTEAARG